MKKMKMLIADDVKSNQKVLRDYILENQNNLNVVMDIWTVDDGKEALKILQSTEIDIFICDLIMPEIDGFGVIDELNKLDGVKKPSIIITSPTTNDNLTNKIINDYKVDYFMVKPFDNEQLLARIKSIIQNLDLGHNQYFTYEPTNNQNLDVSNQAYLSKPLSQCSLDLTLDIEITNILHSLGVPVNIKGYRYLKDAIKMSVINVDILGAITKELYPEVAKKNDSTSNRVERAIRHAIEVSCVRGNIQKISELFGIDVLSCNYKPKNSEFIAKIADNLRLEMSIA